MTALNPPYAAFVGVSAPGAGHAAVASLSPELFLRRTGDTVTSKPIKGTARRADDEAAAAAQRAELEASTKNRAENVMIVDLVRNDLSRVCAPGSVSVPVLLGPEPHPGVWHLVSTVTGTLRPGAGDGDLLRAAFPPGSVTGAPKVRALEIIDELETTAREAYTGAIGYRSPVAGLELNVAIRTFEFAAGKAWIGAGGGIVADSDPAGEYAECLIKATPLLNALGARLDADLPVPGGAAGDAALLPRPAAGVFSSLLVTDGVTHGLADHLARLEGSVRALYGKPLPASLTADLARCLAARPSGRLRITVRPVGGPLQATIEVVPVVPATAQAAGGPAVTLRPAIVPGGLGAHKYRDRRLLAELAAKAETGPDQQLLLTDETGELLETDRANVFAVIDGVLLTPPADGRLLPGTTRAAVLRAAHGHGVRIGQKPLTLDELASATEVFVTNAVVGVVPVTAIETVRRAWEPGPVTAALAATLAARPEDAPSAPAAAGPRLARPYVGGPPARRPGGPAARHPHRQLRLLHLEPGPPPQHRGRARRGGQERRGDRVPGRRRRADGRGDLAGSLRPGRGGDQHRRGDRLRPGPHPAARHLPGLPGDRRRVRRPGRQGAEPGARQGVPGDAPRPGGPGGPAEPLPGDPLPLAHHRRGHAAAGTAGHGQDRRHHDGRQPPHPPGRGRPVPPRVDPDHARVGDHRQLRHRRCPRSGKRALTES